MKISVYMSLRIFYIFDFICNTYYKFDFRSRINMRYRWTRFFTCRERIDSIKVRFPKLIDVLGWNVVISLDEELLPIFQNLWKNTIIIKFSIGFIWIIYSLTFCFIIFKTRIWMTIFRRGILQLRKVALKQNID